MPFRKNLYPRLTKKLADMLRSMPEDKAAKLEEIRIYAGQPVEMIIDGQRLQSKVIMTKEDVMQLLSALSGHALYRFERQMAEGYIPLPGGHRAGVCGAMTRMEDGTWRMKEVSSICLRISRSIAGASFPLRDLLFDENGRVRRVLLLGVPGCGKTTVLRDAALYMAKFVHVAVVDEREELFAQDEQIPNGICMDVMRGTDKGRACAMLIRSMAPQAIICDELGREEDVQAMLDAVRCGVGVLASAHAAGLDDLLARPTLRRLFDSGAFERYVRLGWHGGIKGIWDGAGRCVNEGEHEKHGKLGCGVDGDDRHQQRRISFI